MVIKNRELVEWKEGKMMLDNGFCGEVLQPTSTFEGRVLNGSSCETAIKLNMLVNNERMVLSLKTDIYVDDISIAMVHEQFFAQMIADGKKRILSLNFQLFYHGIVLLLNKTLGFYGISDADLIYARYECIGGTGINKGLNTVVKYYTQVKNLGNNKVFRENNNSEIYLDLSDSKPTLPQYVIHKKIRLLHRSKRPFSYNDVQSVQKLIQHWASSKYKHNNPQRKVSFTLHAKGSGSRMTTVKIEGDLASLRDFVCKQLQTKLDCDSTGSHASLPTVNMPKKSGVNKNDGDFDPLVAKKTTVNDNSNNSSANAENLDPLVNNSRNIVPDTSNIGKQSTVAGSASAVANWKNAHPLEWSADDVQAWIVSSGHPLSEIGPIFHGFNGAQFLALGQKENQIELMLGDAFYAASVLKTNLRSIVKTYNISNKDIKNAAKKYGKAPVSSVNTSVKSSTVKVAASALPPPVNNEPIDDVDAFWQQFSIGDKLLVCDMERKWCPAEIRGIEGSKNNSSVPRSLYISYDGWTEKWNVTIQVNSNTMCNCYVSCDIKKHRLRKGPFTPAPVVKKVSIDPIDLFWKSYSIQDTLKVRDSQGKWYNAEILKIVGDEYDINIPRSFFIHYANWSDQWNEAIDVNEDTICDCNGNCRDEDHRLKRIGGAKTHQKTVKKKQQPKNTSGVVPLQNQGNTCYMNSSLQAVLQIPGLVQYLRTHQKPKKSQGMFGGVFSSTPKMSLLDAFGDLAKKAANGYSTRPTDIRSILSSINPRFGTGQQDDTSLVLSTILTELDKNCANEYAAKNKENLGRFVPSYTVTLEEELDTDDEEFYVEEDILPSHNPFDSVIRNTMDGVEKVITSCMTCDYKKITYCTFREMQLQLMNNLMTIGVVVCIPSNNETFERKDYQVLNYCSIDVLRIQIVRDMESKLANGQRLSLDSVTMCAFFSTKNAKTIDQWAHYYDGNKLCSEIPLVLNAVIDLTPKQANVNNSQKKTLVRKHLMKYEIVLSKKGTPTKSSGEIPAQFMTLDVGGTYSGEQLLGVNYKNSQRLPNESKSKYNLQIFLGNQFVLHSKKYTIRKNMNTFVLIWTPKQALSNVWPAIGKTILDVRRLDGDVSDIMFQVIMGDNAHKRDLPGIEVQLRQRYESAISTDGVYTEKYTTLLYAMSEMAKNILQSKGKVAQFLLPQIAPVSFWKRSQAMADINHPLQIYEQAIILDDQRGTFKCEVCQAVAHVYKEQRTIVYAPQNLILVIDRYGEHERSGKLNHLVRYPVNDPLVFGRQTKAQYNLFATCNHSSSTMKSGHYTANVKSVNSGSWYYTSDSHIRDISSGEVLRKDSIILLYSKIA